ncbi:MAG TPA: 6-carboxytetrahydropterin synthase [Thermomicrobiaceae bacterium]|nr:6-carboxytetrahydropterin synthase [Thermomicrobiaceae bacterium]
MYTVAVSRDFVARHALIGGDWGEENQPHSHHYRMEARLEGEALDEHGYLVDIVRIEAVLDELLRAYRDRLLNDLPEFAGENPSVERFARILCDRLAQGISAPNIATVTLRLWETPTAWAEYRRPL